MLTRSKPPNVIIVMEQCEGLWKGKVTKISGDSIIVVWRVDILLASDSESVLLSLPAASKLLLVGFTNRSQKRAFAG